MIRVVLDNGSKLYPDGITLEPCMTFTLSGWDDFNKIADQLEGKNLLSIQVFKDGDYLACFTDCELICTQTVNNHDGTLEASFYFVGDISQNDTHQYPAYKITK